ncbi:MAG: hypothetical protein JSS53_10210 [Proteobacteria bacterium]|nr:hypothetical protein [Pseudomonadota bacterium]
MRRQYRDGRWRRANGRYGTDKFQGTSSERPFFSSAFDAKIGPHGFAKVKLSLDSNGLKFSAEASTSRMEVELLEERDRNKSLGEIFSGNGSTSELSDSLCQAVKNIGFDCNDIRLKSIVLEGPSATASGNFSVDGTGNLSGIGAKAAAQVTALRVTLESPSGSLTAKLKAGIGYGRTVKSIKSKAKGQPGVMNTSEYTIANWEFSIAMRDNQQTPDKQPASSVNNDNHGSAVGSETVLQSSSPAQGVSDPARNAERPTASTFDSRPKSTAAQRFLNIADQATRTPQGYFVVQPDGEFRSVETQLFIETAAQVAKTFGDDPVIQSEVKKFNESSDPVRAYADFIKNVQQHLESKRQRLESEGQRLESEGQGLESEGQRLESERVWKAWLECSASISLFLAEVAHLAKSPGLSKCATGIAAMTQAVSGMKAISDAFAVVGTLATVTSVCGGVGLVLGAISLLSSLSQDQNDGLGDALSAIHSTLIAMWDDMRDGFEKTWQGQKKIQELLLMLDDRNHDRFLIMLEAMENIHSAIAESTIVIMSRLDYVHRDLTAYLEYLVDQNVHIACQEIATTEVQGIRDGVAKLSAPLYTWLSQGAAITARTGEVKRSEGALVDPSLDNWIQALTEIVVPEADIFDIPFGRFFNIAEEANGKTPDGKWYLDDKKIINPKGWFYVLDVYISILLTSQEKILSSESDLRAAYYNYVVNLLKIIDDTLSIYDIVLHTKLIENLIDGYTNLFNGLAREWSRPFFISTLIPNNSIFNPLLSMSAAEMIGQFATFLNSNSGESRALFNGLTRNAPYDSLPWYGPNADFCDVWTDGRFCDPVDPASPAYSHVHNSGPLRSDDKQLRLIMQNGVVSLAFDNLLKEPHFLLAALIGFAKPSMAYYVQNLVGNEHYYWNFTLTLLPSVRVKDLTDRNEKETVYPFVQANLFRSNQAVAITQHKYQWSVVAEWNLNACCANTTWLCGGLAADYVVAVNPDGSNADYHAQPRAPEFPNYDRNRYRHLVSGYVSRPEFSDRARPEIVRVIDGKILPDAREQALENFRNSEGIERLRKQLQLAYLKLVATIQLIVPGFIPPATRFDEINKFIRLINTALVNKDANSFKDLVTFASNTNIWKKDLMDFMKEASVNPSEDFDFTVKDLLSRLKSLITENELFCEFKEARRRLHILLMILKPTNEPQENANSNSNSNSNVNNSGIYSRNFSRTIFSPGSRSEDDNRQQPGNPKISPMPGGKSQ